MTVLRILFIPAILLFSFPSLAQFPVSPNAYDDQNRPNGYWTVLYDTNYHSVRDPDSVKHFRLIRFDHGKPVGKVRDFGRNFKREWDGFLLSIDPDVKTGETNYYFENGTLRYHAYYVNNKLEGPFQEFNEKGILSADGFMKNDSASGKWLFYFPSGAKAFELHRKAGLDDGISIAYYENGVVNETGVRKNGKRVGEWRVNYPSGTLAKSEYYVDDKKHGVYKHWSESGVLDDEGAYDNDLRTGKWTGYSPEGKKESEGSYVNDKKEGLWNLFYPNGKLKAVGPYANGIQTGDYKFYYDNGVVSGIGRLEDALYTGPWKFYFFNGKLKRDGNYVRDTLQDYCTHYYESGTKESEGSYVMGLENGEWKYYDSAGHIISMEHFKLGTTDGMNTEYFADGSVKASSNFIDGEADGENPEYFENGRLKSTGAHRLGKLEGVWKTYFANGQLQKSVSYINGKEEGPWIYYYSNGTVESQGRSVNGRYTGKLIFNYYNGKRSREGDAIDGKYEGAWTDYDSVTGKKSATGKYLHHKLDGKWIFYSPEGKKTATSYYVNGFWETYNNVCDSIEATIARGEYELATNQVGWLRKVIDRDFPKNHRYRSRPSRYLADIAFDRGDAKESLKEYKIFATEARKLEGDTSKTFRIALNGIALNLMSLNQPRQAIVLYDSIIRNIGRQDTANLVSTLSNKSYALLQLGNKDGGFKLLEDKWNQLRSTAGETNVWTLSILQDMAWFQSQWADDCEKGVKLFEQYASLVEKSAGNKDPRYVNTLRQIGRCYKLLQEPLKSVSAYTKLIRTEEELGLGSSFILYEDLNSLGHVLNDLDRTDSAKIVFNRIISNVDLQLREKTILSARALDGLAGIEYYEDHYQAAIDYWKRGIALMESERETKNIYYSGMLQGVGLSYEGLSDSQQAEAWLRRALEESRVNQGETYLHYQKILGNIGNFYRGEKKFKLADSVLRKALRLMDVPVTRNSDDYFEIVHNLGLLAYDQEDYRTAISYFRQSTEFWREHKGYGIKIYFDKLMDLSRALRHQGLYDDATKSVNEGIKVLEEEHLEKSRRYFDFLTELAEIKDDQGFFSDAEKIHLSVLQQTGQLFGLKSDTYSSKLYRTASFYLSNDELKKAEKYFLLDQQLILSTHDKFSPLLIEVVSKLGAVYSRSDRPNDADVQYKRMLEISEKNYGTQSAVYGRNLRAYGLFCSRYGRRADAAKHLAAASAIAGEIYGTDSFIYAIYIVDEADVDISIGKNAEAEQLLKKARAITEGNLEDEYDWFKTTLDRLSSFYSDMGRHDEANQIVTELQTQIISHEGSGISYGMSLSKAATLQLSAGNLPEARTTIEKALVILHDLLEEGNGEVVSAHNIRGLIALDQGMLDEAEAEFRYCIENDSLNKRTKDISYSMALHNLGEVKTRKGQFAAAEKLLIRSMALRSAASDVVSLEEQANLQDNLAELYQAWGKYDLAEKNWKEVLSSLQRYIRQNFPFMSDYEKVKFWVKYRKDFENFNSFVMLAQKQNPSIIGAMYDLELVTKGILLSASNKIRKRIYASRDSSQINMYYDWVQTREQLAREYALATSAQKTIAVDSLEQKANHLEKELSLSAEDSRPEKTISWKDIQKSLAQDEAAVELIRFRYFDKTETDSVLYAAVVVTAETKTNPKIAFMADGKQLEKRYYRYYRNAVINKQTDTISLRKFWSYIAPMVKGKRKVYIASDGVYSQVNLKTMLVSKDRYLMDDHDIVLVSSTRDVVAIKSARKKRVLQSASLIGNPKFFIGGTSKDGKQRDFDSEDRSGIKALPGTKKEISEVEKMLSKNGWQVHELVGDEASEKNLKQLPSSKIIHIATHGFFSDASGESWSTRDPMLRAGLLLTGAANFLQDHVENNGENGILTAYEASNLSLEGTDLVVLSACETARGEIHQGEGVYGLQRAFITAGAETLVMSLWQVDDEATQKLMTLFYSNLLKGMEKNEALTRAQQELRKEYPHPYYWGAFVMMKG